MCILSAAGKKHPAASRLGNLLDCSLKEIFSGHNFSILSPGSFVSWKFCASSILTDGVSGHNFSTLSWKCAARSILSGHRFLFLVVMMYLKNYLDCVCGL